MARTAGGLIWWVMALGFGCSRPGSEPKGPAAPAAAAAMATPRGRIEGRISVNGPLPTEEALALPESVAKVCGKVADSKTLEVGAGDGLANAVVWVETDPSPRAEGESAATIVLDQRRCIYRPRVATARAGDLLEVRSSDDLLHNVRAGEGTRTLFNLAMPFSGMKVSKPLPGRTARVSVGCDVHPWMRAWVLVFDHPAYALTGADGSFRIDSAPVGTQTIHVWHERFPERSEKVQVEVGRPARLELAWDSSTAVK